MDILHGLEIVYFVRKRTNPDWRVETFHFPMYGFVLIMEGSAQYVINGKEYSVEAGNMVNFQPGCSRKGTTSGGFTCIAVDFSLKSPALLDVPDIRPFIYTKELEQLLKDLEYEWLQRVEGYTGKCSTILSLILHQLLNSDSSAQYNLHVEKIKRYLVENFKQPIHLKQLGEMVGLSSVYCGTLFRQSQGITIAEFVKRIRIQKACDLLMDESYTLSEIAELCGFGDVYYFSTSFKKLMKITPKAYRTHNIGKFK
jgi:AraC-like DNA-binding protein